MLDSLNFLYSLHTRGIKPGLERMMAFLEHIGNPQRTFKSIHVAGTNGKGTVTTIISELLLRSGHSVGLYTSPHINRFNERVVINRNEINDTEIAAFVNSHEKYIRDNGLTFFEVTTALAFKAFYSAGVEYAVVEVGLGGRLDATNVLRPEVSVISDISMDHEEWLGNTIEMVAAEKAGIIKFGVPAVAAVSNSGAFKRVNEVAKLRGVNIVNVFNNYWWTIINESPRGSGFILSKNKKEKDTLYLSIAGEHQVQNAVLAIAALEAAGIKINEKTVSDSLQNVRLCGRLEYFEGSPEFIVDVAHNPKKIAALAKHLERFFMDKKKVIVFGVMKDKNYAEMVRLLASVTDNFVFTQPDNERSLPVEDLLKVTKGECVVPVSKAVEMAKNIAGKDGIVVVTGSFYTVGEAYQMVVKGA